MCIAFELDKKDIDGVHILLKIIYVIYIVFLNKIEL